MSPRDGGVVVVVGVDTFLGGRIATRLAARGAPVVGLTHSTSDAPRTAGAGTAAGVALASAPGHADDDPGRTADGPGWVGDGPGRVGGGPGRAGGGLAAAGSGRGTGPGPAAADTPRPAAGLGGAVQGMAGSGGPMQEAGGGGVVRVVIEGEGPEAVVAAVEAGAGGRRVRAVLHAEIEPERCGEARLGELTPQVWRERCAGPIDRALWTARAGFTLMATVPGTGSGAPAPDPVPRTGGGVLGFVCPSVALTGAAGHVALATTSEAIRLLAKSAARRWGRFGITSNAFAPGLAACLPPGPGDGGGAGLQVHATALDPADVDPADDIASLLLYLAGPGAAGLTGATLGTDGGELMAP